MLNWTVTIHPLHDAPEAEYRLRHRLPHGAATAACRRHPHPLPSGAWVYVEGAGSWHIFKRTANGRLLRRAHYLTANYG